jgi:chemotaxis protein CheD
MENSDTKKVFLNPGDIFVTKEKYVIETILGSCISVCIWDEKNRVAGMNHFVFSGEEKRGCIEKNGRYGKISICYMIKSMIELGAEIRNMRAVIAGGAKNINLGAEVGIENRKIAFKVLEHYRIIVEREETGGEKGRKVKFSSSDGEVIIKYIN